MAAKNSDGSESDSSTSSDLVATTDSESTESLVITRECDSCLDASVNKDHFSLDSNKYKLKEGEMMFDRDGSTSSSMTLSSSIHVLYASNVYRMFFAHTQVIRNDAVRCYTSFQNNPNGNRFVDIPCIEDTRVRVKHPTEPHDYIHASWVDGYREPKKFIISQAPLPNTMEQFWRMHWQENVTVVVSMIQMYTLPKPEITLRYIPVKSGEVFTAGEFSVRHCGTRRVRDTYDATVLKVIHNGEERDLLHMCYFAWPEKGTPTRSTELLNMIADMNYNRKLLREVAIKKGWMGENTNSPISIHCLAGSGRSCVVVALDIACRKLDDTAKRPIGPLADVQDLVLRLRTQRAMAVQKAEQYLFIHLTLYEYAIRHKYVPDKVYDEVDLHNYSYTKKSASNASFESDGDSRESTE